MDISKNEIVLFSSSEEKHYTIANSFPDFQDFLKTQSFLPEDTIIGCESTADYHVQACLAALELGYRVKLLNPLLTKQIINATVRKKKTDFSDAEIIAKLLADDHGEWVTPEFFQQEKRTLLRTEQRLTQCASDLKRVLHSLHEKAKSMDVSPALEAVEHCISVLEEESLQLTQKATLEQSRQEQIIDSIPGCGVKLSALISSEAGDITRFPSSRQFKAFAGIDPKVSQSGNSFHTGHITKRGNPILRHALFLAANVSRQYDPDMKDFYQKKRSEGKSHTHATCAVARKLCERIYAIVSKDEFYKIRTLEISSLQYS